MKANEKKKNEATFAEQEAAFERSAVQTDELILLDRMEKHPSGTLAAQRTGDPVEQVYAFRFRG